MEKQSEYIKSLIEYTNQGAHVIDGKINKDRVVGYLETILFRVIELEKLASKQTPLKPIILASEKDEKVGNIVFAKGVRIYKCQCGKFINFKDNFCPNCGQSLKWYEYTFEIEGEKEGE